MTNLDEIIANLRRELAQLTVERRKLLAEQDEAYRTLDRVQAANAEVLRVINASPGDLAPVFSAILEQAHRICGAELGALVAYEGDHFRALATHDYPPEYAALIRRPFGAAANAYRRLLNGERFVHIPDVVAVPTPGLEDAIRRTAINVAGIRTVLLVPLRKENAFLGYFSAQRREVRPFSEREITLIESFAAQVVIAMAARPGLATLSWMSRASRQGKLSELTEARNALWNVPAARPTFRMEASSATPVEQPFRSAAPAVVDRIEPDRTFALSAARAWPPRRRACLRQFHR